MIIYRFGVDHHWSIPRRGRPAQDPE